jgi:hypothetical protein
MEEIHASDRTTLEYCRTFATNAEHVSGIAAGANEEWAQGSPLRARSRSSVRPAST